MTSEDKEPSWAVDPRKRSLYPIENHQTNATLQYWISKMGHESTEGRSGKCSDCILPEVTTNIPWTVLKFQLPVFV